MQNSPKPGICIFYSSKRKFCLILATQCFPVCKRFLLQHIFVYVIIQETRKGPLFDFGEQRLMSNLQLELCIVSLRWNSTILCYTMMIPHSCCQWHEEDLSDSLIKDTRWKVKVILWYWTLHRFHIQTLQSLQLDWWYFLHCGNYFWHWFWGQNMTSKGQT